MYTHVNRQMHRHTQTDSNKAVIDNTLIHIHRVITVMCILSLSDTYIRMPSYTHIHTHTYINVHTHTNVHTYMHR